MRILVTGCAGPAGRAVAAQLDGTRHEVYGVDMEPRPDSSFVEVGEVPPASDPALLTVLSRFLTDHAINLVIPTARAELPQLAMAASAGRLPAPTVIGEAGAVCIAHDRYLTMAVLQGAGVPVPRFCLPSGFASTQQVLKYMRGPIILKPRIPRGGTTVEQIERESDVDWLRLDDSWVGQEFIPGAEYRPMVYRSHASDDSPLVVVVERRDRTRTWSTGAPRVEYADDGRVAQLALDAAAALGLTGPAEITIRRGADGEPVVLDIAPRFGVHSEYAPEILEAVLEGYGYLERVYG